MALRESKTNIQKKETKDEPQTNGSYKTRQLIIKIMEYTHMHIHPWAKWKQSNKNKVPSVDLANKENKKLYLPVKRKSNLMEKEMANHSSILAWRIPWTEEPGGLQSTGSQRVGYDWATSLSFSPLSWEDFQLLCLLLIDFLSSQRPVTIFFLGCLFFNCITLHTVV